ncbi:MAG: phage tail-like protein [Maribacter sp.]|jgi:phage tail-like protein
MAGEKQTTEQLTNGWPITKFQFKIRIQNIELSGEPGNKTAESKTADGGGEWIIYAQSVEGMEVERSVVEYRHGKMAGHRKKKMPGMETVSNVIIKKGVFASDTAFYDWYFAVKMNLIARANVHISMLDHDGNSIFEWKLIDAFPVKFTPSDLNAEEDGDPAIEELELTFEEFKMGSFLDITA